jgi:hypothetical protein
MDDLAFRVPVLDPVRRRTLMRRDIFRYPNAPKP